MYLKGRSCVISASRYVKVCVLAACRRSLALGGKLLLFVGKIKEWGEKKGADRTQFQSVGLTTPSCKVIK